ncbi:MAG: hypothetical protein RML32_12180 [Gammaproteobacteria bacterium]|nr:hypothetical protein [Gammaproteobacteria bacterium]
MTKQFGNFLSQRLAHFMGSLVASVSVSMAMGQKFGQALLGFAKGMIRGAAVTAVA